MRIRFAVWAALVVSLALLVSACGTAQPTNIRISTGGTTGSFYPQGAGVAEFINKTSKSLKATPTTSGGGTENVKRLAAKEAEFGYAYPGDLIGAWQGEEPFKGLNASNLRVVGPGQQGTMMHMFVLEKSGIKTVDDLAGKKFVSGAPGSTVAYRTDLFLKEAGLYTKMQVSQLAWGELPDRTKNGEIAGYARSGNAPLADITQIALTHPVTVLDLGPAMDKAGFLKKYPFMYPGTIPANTYKNQPQPIRTFAEAIVFATHKDVPDSVVEEFMKVVYTEEAAKQVDAVYKGHGLRDFKLMTESSSVPLHPAAEKFWKAKNINVMAPMVK